MQCHTCILEMYNVLNYFYR